MDTNVSVENIPVILIENKEQLAEAAQTLKDRNILSVDTEFDRMRTKYGMNLELIQIFDGRQVFLIRASHIKDISALKGIFEESKVLKIIYSAREDIEALKSRGISLKGLYDLQEAAKLAQIEAKSFVELVRELVGIELSKSHQKSNWGARKLNTHQLKYAANDVIHSIELYKILKNKIQDKDVQHILQDKNEAIEKTAVVEFTPKLKSRHFKYDKRTQKTILELLNLGNRLARERNVPPFHIFPDDFIEEVINAGPSFNNISSLKYYPRYYQDFPDKRNWINEQIRKILLKG